MHPGAYPLKLKPIEMVVRRDAADQPRVPLTAPGTGDGGVARPDRVNGTSRAEGKDEKFYTKAPALELPKGGGAIRGMGEKFAANPVTGTGSMTVPIATSPGRGGFGPELALSYDSGAGNGPFGLGWSLPIPSITRKTDKGLPQYRDAVESDVFLLSGAEDLVPVVEEELHAVHAAYPDYEIRFYRPRVEGLFARIERWRARATGTVHWRSISKDNITSFYGRTAASRVADPAAPQRVFSWLLCESYDGKGNAIVYDYTAENDARVMTSLPSERTRVRGAARYLKRILYGNQEPLQPSATEPRTTESDASPWLFEVVFDYGEGHLRSLPVEDSTPLPQQHERVEASAEPTHAWQTRPDPFSGYRTGFEVRTHRRCARVLMFHRFEELAGAQNGQAYLVRATEFDYADLGGLDTAPIDDELAHQGSTRIASFIQRVTQSGFVHDPGESDAPDARVVTTEGDHTHVRYLKRSLPPLELTYSKAQIDDQVRTLDGISAENMPVGLDGNLYRWVDLDGEGLSGLLSEQAGAWFYKPNAGGGSFGPMVALPKKPNAVLASGGQQLMDLSGNGQLDVVAFDGPLPGFFERADQSDWKPFRSFSRMPQIDWNNPNLRTVDLTGDGHADVLITEDEIFTWYPSLDERGFDEARRVHQGRDEEVGPRLVLGDGTQSIYLADLSGDGLSDLVRIRNGEVCYWPNLGYGRFGAKVVMDNAPRFDTVDQFNQARIRLADIDGSGTTDILYLHRDAIRVYFNQSGNRWSEARPIRHLPSPDNLSSVTTVDLFGNGTACLVWSSPLPAHARQPLRYLDLMRQKPHLLLGTDNNLGAKTEVSYVSSTQFYLADKRAGRPWITKVPFPVHCVGTAVVEDAWRGTRFETRYSYHHGYFDGHEREFRGFGRVEQLDTQAFGVFAEGNAASPHITEDHQLYQPPVKTITWYHTGAFRDRGRALSQYKEEYFPHSLDLGGSLGAFQEAPLPEPDFAQQDLSASELREALRACKGMPLRQEVYELDTEALAAGEERPIKLFSAAYHNCHIRRLQRRGQNRHAVFLVTESEAITYHYELDLRHPSELRPDPRVAHTLNLNVDDQGNVLQAVAIGYPRFGGEDDPLRSDPLLPYGAPERIAAVQGELHVAYTETRLTTDIDENSAYRARLPCEVLTYELKGYLSAADGGGTHYLTIAELRDLQLSSHYPTTAARPVVELAYHERRPPDSTSAHKRLVEHVRVLFFDPATMGTGAEAPLSLGAHNALGHAYESYKLALTDDLLDAVLGSRMRDARADLENPAVSGYHRFADQPARFWIRSGTAGFSTDFVEDFYQPDRYRDPFGHTTTLQFESQYRVHVERLTDPLGNQTSVVAFDYRVLAPVLLRDLNQNHTAVAFDVLGLPTCTAVMGKVAGDGSAEADHLDAAARRQVPALESAALFATSFAEAPFRALLGTASARHIYSFGEALDASGKLVFGAAPSSSCTVVRETHAANERGTPTRLQLAFEYGDGVGNALVKKALAEPSEDEPGTLRWLASGRTVFNNKGKPVKQYEPYFSATEHRYELAREAGVTSVIYYDAGGRVVRTENPDDSHSEVQFSPWHVRSYDENDTLHESHPWYLAQAAAAEPADQEAAAAAIVHAGTPATVFLDSLGRNVVGVTHNRVADASGNATDAYYETFTRLDAEGKPLYIRDARGNLVMQYVRGSLEDERTADLAGALPNHCPDCLQVEAAAEVLVPAYDLAGNLLFQHSMDGGNRWMLPDAAGEPMVRWDVNGILDDEGRGSIEHRRYVNRYDALHRPTAEFLSLDGGRPQLRQRMIYGEHVSGEGTAADPRIPVANAEARNLRGQLYRHFDCSGLITVERCDLRGAEVELTRRLVHDVRAGAVDWGSRSLAGIGDATVTNDWRLRYLEDDREPDPDGHLETENFRKYTEHDALGRMTRLCNWHRDPNDALDPRRVMVYRPRYNQRGLLASEAVQVGARGLRVGDDWSFDGGTETTVVANLAYNARAQRIRIDKNVTPALSPAADRGRTRTTYEYDPLTFRLRRLRTVGRDDRGDPIQHQWLLYHYDAAGNIVEHYDHSYERVVANRPGVKPRCRYVYDALYRLIEASGREDASLSQNHPDESVGVSPISAGALRPYRQFYAYDEVGNIVRMAHRAPAPPVPAMAAPPDWTRRYIYAPDSNRLLATHAASDGTNRVDHDYDIHGSMLNFARTGDLTLVQWDVNDMIRRLGLGGGGQGHYNYAADKQRTRKAIRRTGGDGYEHLYLGGYELHREYDSRGNITELIETHHVFVDDERVLLIEDVRTTNDNRLRPGVLYRYQHGNHLGSTALEIDDHGEPITYEEYHPYGTSAYRGHGSQLRAAKKRYRYTGMERDEESGLSYHTARYYLPWLGRWSTADPAGLADGPNRYRYSADPVSNMDRLGEQTTSSEETFLDEVERLARSFNNPRMFDLRYDDTREGEHVSLPVRDWALRRVVGGARGIAASQRRRDLIEGQLDEQSRLPGARHLDAALGVTLGLRESGSHLYRGSAEGLVDVFREGGLDYLERNPDELERMESRGFISGSTQREATRRLRLRQAPRRLLLQLYVAAIGLAAERFELAAAAHGFSQEELASLSSLQRRAWVALTYPNTDHNSPVTGGGSSWAEYARNGRVMGVRTVMSLLRLLELPLSAIGNLRGELDARIGQLDSTDTLREVAGLSERQAAGMSPEDLRERARSRIQRMLDGSRRLDVAMRTASTAEALSPGTAPAGGRW